MSYYENYKIVFYSCKVCGRVTTMPNSRSTWNKVKEVLCSDCKQWHDEEIFYLVWHSPVNYET